jgi:hypothetical protein
MEIQINHEVERMTVDRITIFVENKQFEIYFDKFNQLVVNKEQYGSEESAIVIRPRVSNEISIV